MDIRKCSTCKNFIHYEIWNSGPGVLCKNPRYPHKSEVKRIARGVTAGSLPERYPYWPDKKQAAYERQWLKDPTGRVSCPDFERDPDRGVQLSLEVISDG